MTTQFSKHAVELLNFDHPRNTRFFRKNQTLLHVESGVKHEMRTINEAKRVSRELQNRGCFVAKVEKLRC